MTKIIATGTSLEAALDRAVTNAVAPSGQVVDPLEIGCRAICGLYNRPGCLCGSGQWKTCHAKFLYRDHVTAVILAFKAAGVLPRKMRT